MLKDKDDTKKPWFQDIGKPLDGTNEEYFYKAGFASFNGRSRLHTSDQCRYLFGKPDQIEGSGIFRATYSKGMVEDQSICKVCLKSKKA